ncbi:MAG: hypothetical protein AAFW68_01375 [Pseudomonadota bacterium]
MKLRVLAAIGAAVLLGACASYEAPYSGETISVSYDPYDYDPDDLQAEADAHCRAYNLRAVFDGETANPQEVRWRYRHYRCV